MPNQRDYDKEPDRLILDGDQFTERFSDICTTCGDTRAMHIASPDVKSPLAVTNNNHRPDACSMFTWGDGRTPPDVHIHRKEVKHGS